MKKKKSLSQEKYEKLNNLLCDLRSEFSDNDILEIFGDLTDKKYVEYKEKEDTIFDLTCEGYAIFKADYIQGEQLKELAEKYVFPYVNEQQSSILY